MTSTQLQPYELPPFELVKLISSAFAPHTSPAVSPQIPSLSAFSSSTSPHARAGPSSPPSAGKDGTSRQHQHASLTGRLSQLTSKGSVSLSPPSSSNTGFASGSPSGSSTHAIASPELETPRLGPAQAITTGQDVLLSSHAPSAAKPPQSIKAVQAGTESVWIGGNEGSIAVWQLDLTRAKSKGKERAQTDHNVAGSAEEVRFLIVISSWWCSTNARAQSASRFRRHIC